MNSCRKERGKEEGKSKKIAAKEHQKVYALIKLLKIARRFHRTMKSARLWNTKLLVSTIEEC